MKKIKRNFVLTILLSWCFYLQGQEWIQTFSGEYAERGAAIIASPDGSVLVAIETQSLDFGSNPGGDIYLARFDQEGNTIWEDTLEIPANGYGHFQSMILTQDSGYVIMSSEVNILPNATAYLVKLDKYGQFQWVKEYTGIASNGLVARSIIESSEHDYFITGAQINTDSSDLVLMKIDTQGELIWSKTFEIPNTQYEQSITETIDGNLMIGFSEDGTRATLIKVDKNGTELWTKVVADSFRIRKIQETPEGEFLLVGYELDNSINSNFRVTKTSNDGDAIWTYLDGNPDFSDGATDVLITKDGNYLVAGCQSENIGSFTKGWLLKINPLGNLIWQSFLGESIPKRFIFNSMTELPNGCTYPNPSDNSTIVLR